MVEELVLVSIRLELAILLLVEMEHPMVLYHLLKFTILQSLQIKVQFVEEASVNLNIEHDDFEEWLEIREPKGDVNRQSLNLHQC